MIESIAKEFNVKIIDCEIDDKYLKHNDRDDYINRSYIVDGEIVLGLYKDKQKRLISFFHEIGHKLVPHEWGKQNNWDPFLWELECSHRGLKFAEEKGITFHKKTKQWLYRQAISYVDYK